MRCQHTVSTFVTSQVVVVRNTFVLIGLLDFRSTIMLWLNAAEESHKDIIFWNTVFSVLMFVEFYLYRVCLVIFHQRHDPTFTR
jgi:hypothetical protein